MSLGATTSSQYNLIAKYARLIARYLRSLLHCERRMHRVPRRDLLSRIHAIKCFGDDELKYGCLFSLRTITSRDGHVIKYLFMSEKEAIIDDDIDISARISLRVYKEYGSQRYTSNYLRSDREDIAVIYYHAPHRKKKRKLGSDVVTASTP